VQNEHAPDEATPTRIAQLERDLTDSREQVRAIGEVLTTLGHSASDPDAVLETIVTSVRKLCRADVSHIYLLLGDRFELASSSGLTEEYRRWIGEHPVLLDRGTMLGRVALDRVTQQIPDVLADPLFGRQDSQRIGGFRTTVGAPMLLDDEVVGVLLLWRFAVDPFDDRSCDLLTTFAVQAAVAIRQVQLVSALEDGTDQFARKVEQLEALGEVSQVVSSSLDLEEVLSTIVSHAVELSGTDGGSMMEYDEGSNCFRVRFALATSETVLQALRDTPFGLDDTLVGRAAREGRPLQAEDLTEVEGDPHIAILAAEGWRSLLAVPMLREGRIVGALVVRRRQTGAFEEEIADLLETFASQSALALVNARLYRELEHKSAELEVASRHKSEFLASMSHELRTPLNAVLGFSEVLLERMFGDINERQEEYLRDIWSSGKHLLELLNEILDLSKVEAGRMELEISEVDVMSALDYGVSLVRERATLHNINLTLDCSDDVATIDTDELRFKQVVLNLLSNAVKFTPDGGTVLARARIVGDQLVVSVADSGIGIQAADRERIFESFQQGGRGPSNEEGTGLGLTLSRRIVELFGGRLWLESVVGEGSTFSFSVPLGRRTSGSGKTTEERAEEARADVVLIEDDRPSLDLLTVYLSSADLQVTVARDGVEGVEAVRRVKPAAVILDIRLPRMDGWDVLAALKADRATASIPVIVASVVDERQRGLAMGAAAYLIKPVRREELIGHLRQVHALGPPLTTSGSEST
jgi:signal transduction histidine kinase/ActR/RegA family two-component response regulator